MAHGTRINGTAYGITGGKCLVNGTAYSIKKGRTLVSGTGYDISFGQPALVEISMYNAYELNPNFAYIKINDKTILMAGSDTYDPVSGSVMLEVYVTYLYASYKHIARITYNGVDVVQGGGSYVLDITGKTVHVHIDYYSNKAYKATITTD